MEAQTSPLVAAARAHLGRVINGATQLKASDVHLRAGLPPFVRVDGTISRTTGPAPSPEEMEALIALTSGRPVDPQATEFEYSFEHQSGSRYRAHAFREHGRWALTIRVIPSAIPSFQDLRLPPVAKTLSDRTPGLVLITGPTGSGKTTTAVSMLKRMAAEACHVLTIEDPIEYRLQEAASCITQREVGRDTPSYTEGLRSALREDPDVLFIGEIRDREALEVALHAGESGHVVLSTFHTANAVQTIQRLVAMFGADEQVTVRERLADSLRGILSQRLMRRKGARARVLCTEVLVNNYSVKECIRDPARWKTITGVLERSNDKLMHSLDQDLATLVREGLIDLEQALVQAASPSDLKRALSLAGVA